MEFNRILKDLRREMGYTQTQLANRANLAVSCIAMLETNKREPTAQTLISLSKALNVSADYLLGLEDDFGAKTTACLPSNSAETNDPEDQKLLDVYHSLDSDMKDTLWALLNTWTPTTTLKAKSKRPLK